MKILCIGDIHGDPVWKDILNMVPDVDLVIFIGDYVDSFHYTPKECRDNLIDIIDTVKDNPNRFELLLGNHDVHYIYNDYNYRGSGYVDYMLWDYQELFKYDKFKIAHQIDNYLFTHAGISSKWVEYVMIDETLSIADNLNEMVNHHFQRDILFKVGYKRGGIGFGGPLWADKWELNNFPLYNVHQIVGHTHLNNIEVDQTNNNTSVTFIDTLPYYHILEI